SRSCSTSDPPGCWCRATPQLARRPRWLRSTLARTAAMWNPVCELATADSPFPRRSTGRSRAASPSVTSGRPSAHGPRCRAGATRIVYRVNRNPNVWGPVHELLGNVPHISLRPPLDYLPNLQLMKRAALVVTDSGGIQEEATGLGIPCLVLRDVTERPEGVETGALRIVGTDRRRIVLETSRLLDDRAEYDRMANGKNPFGDGHAAERIVASLLDDPLPT